MRDSEIFLKNLQKKGLKSFTLMDLQKAIGGSKSRCQQIIYRLKQKGDLLNPFKGFYIIVRPGDKLLGCMPAEEVVPVLFKHLDSDYYVCLLSAGLYNGASHQKPNRFQVMTNDILQTNPIILGNLKIEFVYKKSIKGLPLKEKVVDTGVLKIATPELLAMDLFLYPRKCGGLNHIATVLSELIEEIDLEKFKKFATESEHTFWMQRMGYILDSIDPMEEEKKEDIMKILEDVLKTRKTYFTPIEPAVKHKGANRNKKWKIIENATVESDV